MSSAEQRTDPREQPAFAALVERHRGELQVHCYRMLGSLEDAEDLVQETFLRAWRSRERFGADGRFSFRAWLYRIATNACLDVLRSRPRRVMPPRRRARGGPDRAALAARPTSRGCSRTPTGCSSRSPRREDEPGAVVVARETIELAFIAAIQHLPPRQRAVLILRDVLGWSAKDTAALLETSVASANSALQRARATLRRAPRRAADGLGGRLGAERGGARAAAPLRRGPRARRRRRARRTAARGRAPDDAAAPDLVRGPDAILVAVAAGLRPRRSASCGPCVTARTASRPPPTTCGRRASRSTGALALDVLRIEDGRIAEITSFVSPELFAGLRPAGELER